MKIAICNDTYKDLPLEEGIEHAAACGYDGLELAPFTLAENPFELTERDAERVGTLIRSAGLDPIGFHYLLIRPDGLHITTPDDATRERTRAFLEHLARTCAALGGRLLILGSPAQRSLDESWNADDATHRAAELLRPVCELASSLGVTLALEPLSPRFTNFMTTARSAIDLMQRIDHPACRIHLDVCSMSSEPTPIPDIIDSARDHLVHFHANDPNLGGPGSGDVAYEPIMRALKRANYEGYLSVEVFRFDPDPKTIAKASAEYLRSQLS